MTRILFACLAAASVSAGAVAASAQPAEPAPPPQPPASAAPAPAAAPAPSAAPVQPILPETQDLPKPTGEAIPMIDLMEQACLPLIAKQDVKSVTKANGLKKTRDGLVLRLPGVQQITVSPPTNANPEICTLTIRYEVDQSKPLVDALFVWAATRMPPLPPLSSDYKPTPTLTTWSWAVDTGQMKEGLVFTIRKKPDGSPVGRGYDEATLLLSKTGG